MKSFASIDGVVKLLGNQRLSGGRHARHDHRQMRAAIEAGIDSADDLTPDERALLDKALNASADDRRRA
ncbi:MAG: hypothetical protein H6962_05770 [Chromatiaceae bacterium]|nr:hypothetical protein [Chromatiaceae bacterium]